MGKIVVLGCSNTDITSYSERFPVDGESMLADAVVFGPGGKGNNQATAASRAGGDVRFVSKVGRDYLSSVVLDHLRAEGMDTRYVFESDSVQTGCAVIQVRREGGENRILVVKGANDALTAGEVEQAEGEIAACDVLLTQLETSIESVTEGLRLAKAHGRITILNPAPLQPVPEDLFAGVDYLTPNETEAEYYTGVAVNGADDARRAAQALISKGARRVVITLGKRGAFFYDGESEIQVPSAKVTAIDTVGAGDAFNGGLAVALSEGLPIERALQFASCVAGLSVTRKGAASSMPTRAEVDALLRGQFGDSL